MDDSQKCEEWAAIWRYQENRRGDMLREIERKGNAAQLDKYARGGLLTCKHCPCFMELPLSHIGDGMVYGLGLCEMYIVSTDDALYYSDGLTHVAAPACEELQKAISHAKLASGKNG